MYIYFARVENKVLKTQDTSGLTFHYDVRRLCYIVTSTVSDRQRVELNLHFINFPIMKMLKAQQYPGRFCMN